MWLINATFQIVILIVCNNSEILSIYDPITGDKYQVILELKNIFEVTP
jgi:hypothetical protein